MSKAFKCDRCDVFFDVGGMQFKVSCETEISELKRLIEFDLCPECAKRVMRFVKPEKPGMREDEEEYVVTDDLS